MGPEYIPDLLGEYKPSRDLRFLGGSQMVEPWVTAKQGENAFSYYAAQRWNKLLVDIKCAPVKTLLKLN